MNYTNLPDEIQKGEYKHWGLDEWLKWSVVAVLGIALVIVLLSLAH